jgi:hypothetical protein
MTRQLDFRELVQDKLVLVALPGAADWVGALRGFGARDLLTLLRREPPGGRRTATHVTSRYSGLDDIAQSNCSVGILNGMASLAPVSKRYFWRSRLERILVPISVNLLLTWPWLLYYQRRRRLAVEGTTSAEVGGRTRRFLVLSVGRRSSHNRRLFAPAHLSPVEIFRSLAGIDYVLLRSVERIEENDAYKDIDLLVADADLRRLHERLGQEVGTLPVEVYAESGIEGHDFNSAPYFRPDMAREILRTAVERPSGIRTPDGKWRYLSLGYHLIFHGKSRRIPPGTTDIGPQTWSRPRHYEDLIRLADEAGFSKSRTFDDIERDLRDNRAFPGKDLIGFYARRNPFIAARYVKREHAGAGLATFFVRDFGDGREAAERVSDQLAQEFRILAQGPITDDNRASIVASVRGGNWQDPARSVRAEPVHWFVCWDAHPITPTGRARRKYPHLDNQRVAEFKLRVRDEAAELAGDPTRLLHASDNSDEAIEHIHAIGVASHPAVAETIARLTRGAR